MDFLGSTISICWVKKSFSKAKPWEQTKAQERKKTMLLRELTAADMTGFAPSLPYRMRGIAGVDDDGMVIGVGGLAYLEDGRVFAFSYFRPDATKYPVFLHKAALKVIGIARSHGVRELYACPELMRSPAAERWLKRLGFEPCQEGWWRRNVRA